MCTLVHLYKKVIVFFYEENFNYLYIFVMKAAAHDQLRGHTLWFQWYLINLAGQMAGLQPHSLRSLDPF